MQNSLQSKKFFVSVVTLCYNFILDLNDVLALKLFFYKIDFSFKKISYMPMFRFFFVFYVIQ